jgi:hypothetical protein
MPHDHQQKGPRNDKSGKQQQQKDMPKQGAGQEAQKSQTDQQKKDEASHMEQNR